MLFGVPHKVLFVKKLLSTSSEKEWKQTAESSTSVNLWDKQAKECRARRAMAASLGLHIDKVSLADVEASSEGVEGWPPAQLIQQVVCFACFCCCLLAEPCSDTNMSTKV